jgi:hypothetical protein
MSNELLPRWRSKKQLPEETAGRRDSQSDLNEYQAFVGQKRPFVRRTTEILAIMGRAGHGYK